MEFRKKRNNKTKKKIGAVRMLTVLMVIFLGISITACGKKVTLLDEVKLSFDLQEEVEFETALYQVKQERISDFIDDEKMTHKIMYMGNGTFADSFGIFTYTDEEGAKASLEDVNLYLDDLKTVFEDYLPKEASKIENGVVIQKGKYIVFCITSDYENAKAIIEESFTQVDEKDVEGGNSESSSQNLEEDEDFDSADAVDFEEKSYPKITGEGPVKDFGAVVMIDGAGYEIFNFDKNKVDKYIEKVNAISDRLSEKYAVYDIVIPLSTSIKLPDNLSGEVKSSNEEKALSYIYEGLNDNVRKVKIFENLMNHRLEYVYFKTDHHWTALGAYYAYEEFCKEKGILPISLEQYETSEFKDFLGSFYKDTKNSKEMKENKDTIVCYHPISENAELKYTTTEGKEYSWKIINDVSSYPDGIKYSTFIAGDNPMTEITNNDISDGETCIVIKESFGNAFVPFLVDHYSKIYVIDYRYWEGNLEAFADEVLADDIVFLNNLSMTRSDYLIGKIGNLIP